MSIINNGLLLASGADAATTYQISRSIRLNSPDSAYFSRTPGSAGNRKTWTWSGWVKRNKLGTNQALIHCRVSANTDDTSIAFTASDTLRFVTGTSDAVVTNAVFRDVSAWYHIVCVFDTTQATAVNRIKLYVNGVEQTFASTSYPSQNSDWSINSASAHNIGAYNVGVFYGDYMLADVYLLDGTATTPSTFAETDAITGQWVPKTPTGISYGTNGFRLTFSDNSGTTSTTLGKDSAGSNNWTPNNFSVASGSGNDSLVDSPTSYGTDTGAGGEVRGNYCTLSPLDQVSTTLTNGNLDASIAGASTAMTVCGSIAVTTGKWYWEVTATSSNLAVGVQQSNFFSTSLFAKGVSYYSVSGEKYVDGSASSYGSSFTTNDVIGIALNLDSGTVQFYKNNTAQGSISLPTSNSGWKPAITNGTSGGTNSAVANFGQRAFAYTAPSGFKALCDTNLTAPVIAKPNTVMDVLLWSGTGGNRSFSSLNMSPDFVWIKQRNQAFSTGHQLYDIVRGAGSDKELNSAGTAAEGAGNIDQYGWLSSFDSNGFSVTAGPIGADYVNASGTTYVAWAWDAGTSTVTNTQGSITSSVRANASAGFSVVTYTGTGSAATVGHGLGAAPSLIITKRRNSASNWGVYHRSLGATQYLLLNTTDAGQTSIAPWNDTAPTSTVFSVRDATFSNESASFTYVAYCFAPVAGYSSFGGFVTNGADDNVFVYTGFRPRWIMWKRTDAANSWGMVDTARNTYNVVGNYLLANASDAEANTTLCDILSNGFKMRTSGFGNGQNYIYFAVAESPFAYSRAR